MLLQHRQAQLTEVKDNTKTVAVSVTICSQSYYSHSHNIRQANVYNQRMSSHTNTWVMITNDSPVDINFYLLAVTIRIETSAMRRPIPGTSPSLFNFECSNHQQKTETGVKFDILSINKQKTFWLLINLKDENISFEKLDKP